MTKPAATYEITVSGWFSAAHQLRLPDGSLEPLHGHNWNIRVTYAGAELDEMGVLVDFIAVRRRLNEVLATLHDRCLNELAPFQSNNPSAEHVAQYIAERMQEGPGASLLRCVEVEEEPGCFARYRR